MTYLAILTYDFYPQIGGVQTYLFEITRRLAQNTAVTVLTSAPGRLSKGEPFQCRRLDNPSFLYLTRQLGKLHPRQVLVGHAHPKLLLAAWIYSRKNYATLAYGNDFLAAQNRWHRPFFNFLLRQSTPLITITQANAQRLMSLGLPQPIVVYPGTDPQRFLPLAATHQSSTSLCLITVGRLVPRKGIDRVIEALPALLDTFPQLTYRIVGEGPDRTRLENLAARLNVTPAVQFSGSVTDEELTALYRQADIFVMPNREIVEAGSVEGFGIVFLEASASGLPVVAGRSGGAVEAVRDGETGFLVPPDDVETLTSTLRRLLSDAELREQLGQNGRTWVENQMNWDRAAQEMAQALGLS